MEAFLVATGVVALAEIGDQTQLLALLLATRFRIPLPIVLGIFVATVFNHALAGAVGSWIATVALAAQCHSLVAVVLGTTLGMMLANVPVVYLGDASIKRVSIKAVRIFAALSFLTLGVYVLMFT